MANIEPIQLPQYRKKDKKTFSDTYGKFEIGPFEPGFGTTIGNSLRRTLLSSIQGGAVKFVHIDGLHHQYIAIPGAREDYIELILNLKNLILVIDSNKEQVLELNIKGPKKVTAKDISAPQNVTIVNKDHYLLELTEKVALNITLWVGNGIGYKRENEHIIDEEKPVGVIAIDSIYSPIRKVNYHVGKERVDKKINYDKIILEITTDGSISPEESLNLAAKLLKDSFDSIMQFKEEPKYIKREKVDPELRNLQKLMKMDVAELELSVRCRNCLAAAKIDNVKELVALSETNTLRLRNFGKKSLAEVKKVLKRYGLKLGMDVKEIDEKLKRIEEIEENNETP
ncbi:MAG: DNA-directed RNA polymerase subunit alpha [Candidatus Cloacimonadota bacterium]|nr:DNA-directed RNA polymerase subunit alpha [Candidatus Cloacimonadota bacterium]